MLRRIEIEPDNVGGLALEIRIIARHITLQPMWLETGFLPDALHSVLADVQVSSQFPAGPMRGTVAGLASGCGEHSRLQCRCDHRRLLSGMSSLE
jgi:hypothetical protein